MEIKVSGSEVSSKIRVLHLNQGQKVVIQVKARQAESSNQVEVRHRLSSSPMRQSPTAQFVRVSDIRLSVAGSGPPFVPRCPLWSAERSIACVRRRRNVGQMVPAGAVRDKPVAVRICGPKTTRPAGLTATQRPGMGWNVPWFEGSG